METIRPKIVCLCGSSRFYQEYQEAEYRETMEGRIYLSIGFYPHAAAEMHGEGVGATSEEKIALDELHKRKIDLADEVLVLNVGGYIGDSTKSEVVYAIQNGKPIRWLEPDKAWAVPEDEQSQATPSNEVNGKTAVENEIVDPPLVRLVRLIQCVRRPCGHVLTEDERDWEPQRSGGRVAVCPACGGSSFYTLKENGQATVWSERDRYRNGIDPLLIEPGPRMGEKKRNAILAAKRRILEANMESQPNNPT